MKSDKRIIPGATQRRIEVMCLLADGLENEAIGALIGLSEKTIKAHVTEVFIVLHVTNRTECAMVAKETMSNWLRDYVFSDALRKHLVPLICNRRFFRLTVAEFYLAVNAPGERKRMLGQSLGPCVVDQARLKRRAASENRALDTKLITESLRTISLKDTRLNSVDVSTLFDATKQDRKLAARSK